MTENSQRTFSHHSNPLTLAHPHWLTIIVAGLRYQKPSIPFCLAIPSFPLSPYHFNGSNNGSRKHLQIVAKFPWIVNPICRVQYKFLSFKKNVLPIPLFADVVENIYNSFSRKLFNKYENCLWNIFQGTRVL